MVEKLICILLFPFKILIAGISLIFPKQKNLWIFSAWEGKAFNDNSKYFFRYVVENHPEIEAVWITHNQKLNEELNRYNIKSLHSADFLAWWKMLRAKLAITTHGVYDFHPSLIFGSTHLELGHATCPIKKMEYDADGFVPENPIIRMWKFIRLPFLYKKANYATSTTTEMQKIVSSSLRIPKKNVFLTGQPRFDFCVQQNLQIDQDKLEKIFKGLKYDRIIYFMPTFRNDQNYSFFSKELNFDLESLEKILEKDNALFIIRLHPFDIEKELRRISINSDRIIIENHGLSDPYPLLKISNILITDYSSIFADFLLLRRPVIFAKFNHEDYIKKERELYWNYDRMFSRLLVKDWHELIDKLDKYNEFDSKNEIENLYELIIGESNESCSKKLFEVLEKEL